MTPTDGLTDEFLRELIATFHATDFEVLRQRMTPTFELIGLMNVRALLSPLLVEAEARGRREALGRMRDWCIERQAMWVDDSGFDASTLEVTKALNECDRLLAIDAQPSPAPESPAKTSLATQCCGAWVYYDWRFCPRCGVEVHAQPPKFVTECCGVAIDNDWRFCPKCGYEARVVHQVVNPARSVNVELACGAPFTSETPADLDPSRVTCKACGAPAPSESRLREALRTLRDTIVRLWGNPEDCDDCADIEERPCQVHESAPLFQAMLDADEVLGPCVCGHHQSQHLNEDTTRCRECGCNGFSLPPALRPASPVHAQVDRPYDTELDRLMAPPPETT